MTTGLSRALAAAIVAMIAASMATGDEAPLRQVRDAPYAQVVVRQWTAADGLPDDAVERIWVDGSGRVVAKTPEGFAALDRERWVRTEPSPEPPLPTVDDLPRRPPWEPVTVAGRDHQGRLWIGTVQGLARWTGKRWHAYHSRRWLPDDRVNDVAFDGEGAVWVATAGGAARIATEKMTLEGNAERFHAALRKRHVWRGLVRASRLESPGQVEPFRLPSDDNDGLWTALYVAAESFRYAATGDDEARRNATESLDALLLLESITDLPGFIARSYMPAGEGPQHGGEWHRSRDGRWDWKGDTSSDELDGHVFAWSVYYDLVADEAYRRRIAEVASRVMDRILGDGYLWLGPNDKPTTWGMWAPDQLNHHPKWILERGLNSLEILSHLKVAHHVTGDEKYHREYMALIDDHGYAINTILQKIVFPPTEVNHSDDELAFLAYYPLLQYEKDPRLREIYRMSLERSWLAERPERSALFNFIYGSAADGPFDLAESVASLRDVPLDLVCWTVRNSTRNDVPRAKFLGRFDQAVASVVLPPSERRLIRWNGDPYQLDGGHDGLREDDGTFFLLPYWMARYYQFLVP
jgi:hypothetical protein